MKRIEKVRRETTLTVGDEVLYEGEWKKIIDIKPEFILLEENTITSKEDLIPNWELDIKRDFSDPTNPEVEIAIIKTDKEGSKRTFEASESKIILFNENSSIVLTKYNVEKMVDIAKKVKDYMNSAAIAFEKG